MVVKAKNQDPASGIIIYQDGKVVKVDPNTVLILGYQPDALWPLLESDGFYWVHDQDRNRVATAVREILNVETPSAEMYVLLNAIHGIDIFVDVYISLTLFRDEPAALLLWILRDQEQRVEVDVMQDILIALAGAADIHHALEIILVNLHNLIHYDRVGLFLADESQNALVLGGSSVEPGRRIEVASQDHPLVSEFQTTGRPIIVKDVQTDERFSNWKDIGPVRGWLGAPLLAGERFVGFLSMGSLEVGAYGPADEELMAKFAVQIAEVLDKAWTYEQSKRRTEQLEVLSNITFALGRAERRADTLSAIVAEIAQFFDAQSSVFFMADPGGDNLRIEVSTHASLLGYAHPLGDDILWQVFRKSQTSVIVDMPEFLFSQTQEIYKQMCSGASAAVFIPLAFGDANFGILCLAYKRTRFFSFADIRLYDMVAEIASASLHRAVMLQTLERQVDIRTSHLSTLYEINAVASQPLDLDMALERILEILLIAMAGPAGVIHLLDDQASELKLIVQQGFPVDMLATIAQLPLDDHKTMRALLSASEPLVAPQVDTEQRLPESLRIKPVQTIPTYIGVPIRMEGRELGLLSIYGVNVMEDAIENLALLMTITDQIGAYIERANLIKKAERAAVIEERQRLARELHDSVTQLLYSQVLFSGAGLKVLNQGNAGVAEEHLGRIHQAALQALKEMRLMIYEFRPGIILDEGLVVALERRLDAVERRTGVEVTFQVKGAIDLDREHQMALFRIAEEALNNTLKHAHATSVAVKLVHEDGKYCLQISDNGCGFAPQLQNQQGGMGLLNMSARVAELGGELELESSPGEGTILTVWINTEADIL